jgi:hypothetical protein
VNGSFFTFYLYFCDFFVTQYPKVPMYQYLLSTHYSLATGHPLIDPPSPSSPTPSSIVMPPKKSIAQRKLEHAQRQATPLMPNNQFRGNGTASFPLLASFQS